MSKVVKMTIWVDPVDPKTDEVYGIYAEISDAEWEDTLSRGILIREFVYTRIGNELQALLRKRWSDENG